MQYTVAKRGWVLLNDKGKVVVEGTKAVVEKAAFQKLSEGHTLVSGAAPEPKLPLENDD